VDLAARQLASHHAFYERLAAQSERLGGATAFVTPAARDRSIPNAVLYDDPGAVLAGHDDLVALYAAAGVRAWTVWVRPGDEALAAELAARGHAADGTPALMGAAIADVDLSASAPLPVAPLEDWETVGAVNERAYGVTGFAAALAGFRVDDRSRAWAALDGDAPVATVGVIEEEGDAYVCFVATDPAARGRGLCRGLMAHALREAAARGCTTTTLEGSPMGEPIYTRMGYGTLGRLQLWERRIRDESA